VIAHIGFGAAPDGTALRRWKGKGNVGKEAMMHGSQHLVDTLITFFIVVGTITAVFWAMCLAAVMFLDHLHYRPRLH
jgi:hypothetical protein